MADSRGWRVRPFETEIQDPDRRPAAPEAHGLPRRVRPLFLPSSLWHTLAPAPHSDTLYLPCRAVLADIMKAQNSFWVSKEEWAEQGVRALDKLGPRE